MVKECTSLAALAGLKNSQEIFLSGSSWVLGSIGVDERVLSFYGPILLWVVSTVRGKHLLVGIDSLTLSLINDRVWPWRTFCFAGPGSLYNGDHNDPGYSANLLPVCLWNR